MGNGHWGRIAQIQKDLNAKQLIDCRKLAEAIYDWEGVKIKPGGMSFSLLE